MRDGFTVSRQRDVECGCCEMMVLRVCGSHHNFYLFALYRSPSGDNRLYDCLLRSMSTVQERDMKSAFVFVSDRNAHHAEWLGSATTDAAVYAALDFASVASCQQFVGETKGTGACWR